MAAPDMPGMLQARSDAAGPYPDGKSAMVLYACCRPDETLRGYVRGRGAASLDRAVRLGARLIRFGVSPVPDREFDRLMRRFVDRFGARPTANRDDDVGLHDQNHDDHHDDNKEPRRPNG
jgi:hypothetical protein